MRRVYIDSSWMRRGACASEPRSTMFPSNAAGVAKAKKVCQRCPVQGQCLEYALSIRERHGVWGNTSESERKRMLRERRKAAA